MTENVPSFEVGLSPVVSETLRNNGLTVELDKVALDAMAAYFGVKPGDNPRVVLAYEGEDVHSYRTGSEDDAESSDAAIASAGDYLVRLIKADGIRTRTVSAGLASSFQRERRASNGLWMLRAGAGMFGGGILLAGVGYIGMSNEIITKAGYGLAAVGAGLVTYAATRDPYGKPPNISHLRHPIRIVPGRLEREAIEGVTVP